MGRTATILLREHVDDDLLLQIAYALNQASLGHRRGFLDEIEPARAPEVTTVARVTPVACGDWPDDSPQYGEDEELALFRDYSQRCHVRGFYSQDEMERRSRRIDLRGPTDHDPGPIEMTEADAEDPRGIMMRFER